jgi:glycine oxidase
MGTADVVVAGAGVIGLAVAWRAAEAGLSVTVVDPAPAGGASFVAAGMLAPVGEARWGEEDLLALNLRSAARWSSFARELETAAGRAVGYLECGSLLVGLDGGDRSVLEDLHRFQLHIGLAAEWLAGSQCREVEPLLSPGVRCGILVAGDHQVDPRQVLDALLEACRRCGVAMVTGSVERVLVDGGRASGVEVAGAGSIVAGRVVLAAGCWSGGLAGLPDVARPVVRPLKGQILQLAGPAEEPVLRHVLRCVVGGRSCYLLPRADGRVVLGSTSEEMGFDTRVTAGAVYELLREASRALPAVAELELREARAGLRPATPDNLPIVGSTPVDDLLLATGHGRNGILLCPVTADLVLGAIRGEEPPPWAAACSPARPGATAGVPAAAR